MNAERASQILRKLDDLKSQMELSLSFQKRRAQALHFHRQLDDVISDIKHLAIRAPLKIDLKLKSLADETEHSVGDPAL